MHTSISTPNSRSIAQIAKRDVECGTEVDWMGTQDYIVMCAEFKQLYEKDASKLSEMTNRPRPDESEPAPTKTCCLFPF